MDVRLVLLLFSIVLLSCEHKNEAVIIHLKNSVDSIDELNKNNVKFSLSDNVGFDIRDSSFVLQIDVFNGSNDSLCLDVQNWSNDFLNVSKIQSKFPIEENLNNWRLDILDNWGLKNEECLGVNESRDFFILMDKQDLINDSLIVTFSSSTLKKGLSWKLPHLKM